MVLLCTLEIVTPRPIQPALKTDDYFSQVVDITFNIIFHQTSYYKRTFIEYAPFDNNQVPLFSSCMFHKCEILSDFVNF